MVSSRRRGQEDSATRARLIETAERLVAEQGVAAASARNVAKALGLSHQIVHYYFKSMDDLLIAVIDFGMARAIGELDAAVESGRPLTVIARQNSALLPVVMGTEFTLYARDRPAVREAVSAAIIRFRQAQARLFARHDGGAAVPPVIATILATSVLRAFALETAVGVTEGHDETRRWLQDVLGIPAEA